jgi:LmbE family N-acetylglucosaminyl deacetylase
MTSEILGAVELDGMVRPSRRRALVLAHPDDESLWAAGLLIRYPGDWTAICCSIPARDPIRAWKFFDACEVLGARARLMPFVEKPNAPLDHLGELELDGFDLIVTHGAAGEYGHPAHVALHELIARRRSRFLAIGYRKAGAGELALQLSPAEWTQKLGALRCYDNIMTFRGRRMMTWEALRAEYGATFDLQRESYDAVHQAYSG